MKKWGGPGTYITVCGRSLHGARNERGAYEVKVGRPHTRKERVSGCPLCRDMDRAATLEAQAKAAA